MTEWRPRDHSMRIRYTGKLVFLSKQPTFSRPFPNLVPKVLSLRGRVGENPANEVNHFRPFLKTFRPFPRNHARIPRHLITWHSSTHDLRRHALTHSGLTALERTTLIFIRNDSHLHRKLGPLCIPTNIRSIFAHFLLSNSFAFRLSSHVCNGINSEINFSFQNCGNERPQMPPPLGRKPNRPVEGREEKTVRRLPLSRQLT